MRFRVSKGQKASPGGQALSDSGHCELPQFTLLALEVALSTVLEHPHHVLAAARKNVSDGLSRTEEAAVEQAAGLLLTWDLEGSARRKCTWHPMAPAKARASSDASAGITKTGIVSKSYECRLKGQGATFVETDSPFTAAALAEASPVKERPPRSSRRQAAPEQVQQVIIIQGCDGEFALDASVEETAAATLQTLALAGQVARVVHITEDGQVIAASQSGAHLGGVASGPVLPEQLADGATQVVVVGGSMDGRGMDEPLSPGSAVIQQVTKQEILGLAEAGVPPPDTASALDALLCAVTELGGAEGRAGPDEKSRSGPKDVLVQLPGQEAPPVAAQPEAPELHMFQDVRESGAAVEPVEVLTQVVRPSAVAASQERTQVAFKKVVQGVLQFAVCDPATAGQLMKEGVTQLIVNEEGTVHMLAREGSQIIMQEAEAHGPHVDLAEPDGEISQIIVTEELVQAMVQESSSSFPEGATHYIVTELPPGVEEEAGVYSHTVIEAADSQEILQAGATLSAEAMVPNGSEQLTSMVIYTQDGSPAATVIQSQRESNELQEA
ncbi:hypothetical protein PANDA_013730 [Ailuropoda melanoleuca]|uniref:Zinc finger protein 407 n=1 Tax=Ailuropoda melanoleuca TaxID=9646 RepID=D2HPL3_AILME|nr:hypothetical protein PANDA_013730 [Ailuropoda melanoleuca]